MPSYEALRKWQDETKGLGFMMPDYHRLQVEHFVWREAMRLMASSATPFKRVLEIGAEGRKPYLGGLGEHYITVNVDDPSQVEWGHEKPPGIDPPTVIADIGCLPFKDNHFAMCIATETLEHVLDPWAAVQEVYRILAPGGVALFTTPFMWPYHGCARYPDLWRFTGDGYRLLCKGYESVRVLPTAFMPSSPIGEVMQHENMGNPDEIQIATGYMVVARKG